MKTKNKIRSTILREQKKKYRSGKALLKLITWERVSRQIDGALKNLLSGRDRLRMEYQRHVADPGKIDRGNEMTFALDGRLVGDIGELISAQTFRVNLLRRGARNVDAVTTTRPKRKVQIKATFLNDSLSIKHGYDYFIGLQLNDERKFRIVYNGPAKPVMDYLKAPKAPGHKGRRNAGKRLEPISLGTWAILSLAVKDAKRIARR